LNKTSHSSIVRIQIEPDGVLGMHPAIEDQLFIVVQGNGLALSKDVDPIEIVEGDVVFWQGGEFHETRSGGDGLTAIVLEGPALGTAIRRKGERDA
jgi:quercetin dioxygenase-like cupin family protein